MRLFVKNWSEFQHYKDRSPTWIKLHKGLLDDFEYQCLPLTSRALAPMIWLLASENVDGSIEYDTKKIAFRLRTTEKEVKEAISPLIDSGFLIADGVASNALAECYQYACLEKRREETYKEETEIEIESAVAPKKLAKKATQIPSDFMPNENGIEYAVAKKLNYEIEIESFRNFHEAKGSTWKDWQATWRTWCDKAVEYGRAAHSAPKQSQYKTVGQERADTIATLTGRTSPDKFIEGTCHAA